jgi:hypothetical protein
VVVVVVVVVEWRAFMNMIMNLLPPYNAWNFVAIYAELCSMK